MKKYSKNNLKMARGIKFMMVLLLVIFVLSISFAIFVIVKNNITIEKMDYSAKDVDDNIATNSTPIVVNNFVIGGVYDKKFVSAEKFYLKSNNKFNIDLDVYTKTGKSGEFSLSEVKKTSNSNSIYASIKKSNNYSEYFAIAKTGSNIKQPSVKEVKSDETIISQAKKALGIYRLFNTSIKIESAYEVNFTNDGMSRILFVTNEPGKMAGAYSSVIYISPNGKSKIIKYSYVKDVEKASDWPVYSLEFVADLNNDGKSEIILQETREFNIKYDVIEYNKNKFKEILSTEFDL